jgi:hypothetical protein
MLLTSNAFWRDRLKASGIHLGLSMTIALAAALLVFGIWYPYPYREISGGRELFLLVVTVDVILGPPITLAVFNRTKPWPTLRHDLVVVAIIQLAALGYGLWTVSVARPVHMVFEFDRFRIVHAIEIPPELIERTPSGVNALPLWGPTPLAVREFRNGSESADATLAAIQGVSLSARPDLWEPYASAVPRILQAAKPIAVLKTRFPAKAADIDRAVIQFGGKPESALYLPLTSRSVFWTAFLDPANATVIGAMPLDSF